MAVTCYCVLSGAQLESAGPPAVMGLSVSYQLVDTAVNAAIPTATGDFTNGLLVTVNCPVASQNAVLPNCTAAIQAAEPAHPGLSFIWIGL